MYLSNSHPGINTSPQPPIQETKPKSNRNLEKVPKLHYDGDESDANTTEEFGDAELLYHRQQAFSLPDLLIGSSMSTSAHSLHPEDPLAEQTFDNVGAAVGKSDVTPPRSKKRRKRRSESEIESPSKLGGVGCSQLTITKSRGSNPPSFLASTPLVHHLLNEIPLLRAHWDLGNSIGRRRGVCGCNSTNFSHTSYLDVTLFTFFYYTDQFDDWILDEKIGKGFPTPASKEVRSLLRKEILYSLRIAYYCPSISVGKLIKVLFPASQPQPLEFSQFCSYFLEKVLTLPENTHYTNGSSKLIHVLQQNAKTGPTSIQYLFQQSLGDLKLLSVPHPGLFFSVENPLNVPHPAIVPNLQLDLSRTLIQLSDDNDTEDCIGLEKYNLAKTTPTTKNYGNGDKPGSYFSAETQFCKWFRSLCKVIYVYLENLVEQTPTFGVENASNFNHSLITIDDSADDNWSATPAPTSVLPSRDDVENPLIIKNRTKKFKGKLNLALDLMAVICLEPSETKNHRYTAFVRCGQNPRRGWAPWVHFTPCDKGAPLVRRVEDVGKWLNRLAKRPEKVKSLYNAIPTDILNLLTSSTFFIYTPKPDYESQNTLFSYVNEC